MKSKNIEQSIWNNMNKAETEKFNGTVKSGLAATRKVLKTLGLPLGRIEGRYEMFGKAQTVIEGLRAQKIGCSRSIGLDYLRPSYVELTDERRQVAKTAKEIAIDALRLKGLPFDERGYMECEYYDL